MALKLDGTQLWEVNVPRVGWGGPSIADIDGDGQPEIIASQTIINSQGNILWNASGGQGGIARGGVPIVSDLDGDGMKEVIFGNTIYNYDGTLVRSGIDGFSAVANLQGSSEPEIVIVSNGSIFVRDNSDNLIWQQTIPGGGHGGTPTVADFDGDGNAEIGVAAASQYSVFNGEDGAIIWSTPVNDASSNVTGSSVFDFDGDGTAEVVYADETTLYVFDGPTGETLFEVVNSSGTALEYPVVADIDNDSHAEIVVAANRLLQRLEVLQESILMAYEFLKT